MCIAVIILFGIVTCDAGIQENYLGTGNDEYKRCPTTEDSECILSKINGYGMVKFKCNDMGFGSGHGNWILIGNLIIFERFHLIFYIVLYFVSLRYLFLVHKCNKK